MAERKAKERKKNEGEGEDPGQFLGRNWKLGGRGYRQILGGGENMRKAQIFIKNKKIHSVGEGCRHSIWGSLHPGGCKISLTGGNIPAGRSCNRKRDGPVHCEACKWMSLLCNIWTNLERKTETDHSKQPDKKMIHLNKRSTEVDTFPNGETELVSRLCMAISESNDVCSWMEDKRIRWIME